MLCYKFVSKAGWRGSCQGVWGGAHGNEVVLKENSACNGVECDTTRLVNGMSALGLQRVLGLGRYRSAWLMLHKLRRAMVRPHREKLKGVVEMDETYWGAAEAGVATGWLIFSKALIIIAPRFSMAGQLGESKRKPTTCGHGYAGSLWRQVRGRRRPWPRSRFAPHAAAPREGHRPTRHRQNRARRLDGAPTSLSNTISKRPLGRTFQQLLIYEPAAPNRGLQLLSRDGVRSPPRALRHANADQRYDFASAYTATPAPQ